MASSRSEIEARLRAFLVDLVEDFYDRPYDGEDPLADGEVDSLGIEQLIGYLDSSFGLALPEEDIVADNFESLAALAALVESRQRVAGP